MYLHRYLSQWLHNDKPFDEKVETMIENYKSVDVSQKNENEQQTSEIIEKEISKYIEGYVRSVSDFENADKKSFEWKYKYYTLKYFYDILGIE